MSTHEAPWRARLLDALSQRFELLRGELGHNLQPMEGMRGLAVFLVFLVHYVTLSLPWVHEGSTLANVADLLHAMGNVGVDLFFVLSGYLIYGSLVSRRQGYGGFLWRRVVRIYPAFVVMLALYLVLSFVFPKESKLPKETWDAVVFVLANALLLPGLFPITPIITVAWSLSYEFFYYLLMPLVAGLLALRARSTAWRLRCFIALGLAGVVAFALWGGPVRLLMFVPGILLFEWLQQVPRTRGRGAWGVLALLLALAVAAGPAPGPLGQATKVALLGLLFMLLCHVAFSERAGGLARALSWTPLRWLGNMSYSFYLIHGLSMKPLFMLVAKLWPSADAAPAGMFWWMLPIALVVCCAVSTMLFLAIERPYSLVPKAHPVTPAGEGHLPLRPSADPVLPKGL